MDAPKCELCGEPMPPGEEMFKFHGYSGPCPKPPLLQPHEMRVVSEKKELDSKLDKLTEFHKSETFAKLPADEQDRLTRQAVVMGQYSGILAERIAAFKK